MKVYEFLKNISEYLFVDAKETQLTSPESVNFDYNAYAFDTLNFQNITHSGNHSIETVEVKAVIFFYTGNIPNIDDFLTRITKALGYQEIKNILDNFNEIISVNIDKIIVYGKNSFNKQSIAIHITIITNV